jgi:hypothetical protein
LNEEERKATLKEESVKKLVEKIMKEGAPLFTRESIAKMLICMNHETEKDLRCCGNCNLFRGDGRKYFCKQGCIHTDHCQPWKSCKEWKFDEADSKRRMGGSAE